MPMRATWKGVLKLGKQPLPVKLYAAVHDTTVHFHLLHAKDGVRVEQHLISTGNGEQVESSAVQKGFALEPGKFVILKQKELKALKPEASRDIELLKVVPAGAIAPAWFERPYLVGPEGSAAAYLALAQALSSQERQVIVSWAMRGRSYTGALRAQGERLLLISLRDREQVIEAPNLSTSKSRAPESKELALAEQLVSAEPIEREDLARGYEYEPGKYVQVSDDELAALEPDKSRDIDLRLFVPESALDPVYFERMYFLTPSGDSNKAYHLLASVMQRTGRAGIATFVMHDREYLVAIFAQEGLLCAEVLRFHTELRDPGDVPLGAKSTKADSKLVKQFEALLSKHGHDKFDPSSIHAERNEAMRELAAKKAKKKQDLVEVDNSDLHDDEDDEDSVDLMKLLKQSMR
jgi:DNA end-binding protein Ku